MLESLVHIPKLETLAMIGSEKGFVSGDVPKLMNLSTLLMVFEQSPPAESFFLSVASLTMLESLFLLYPEKDANANLTASVRHLSSLSRLTSFELHFGLNWNAAGVFPERSFPRILRKEISQV